jgi:hypothetical protein
VPKIGQTSRTESGRFLPRKGAAELVRAKLFSCGAGGCLQIVATLQGMCVHL